MNRKPTYDELKKALEQALQLKAAADLELDAQELLLAALLRSFLAGCNGDKAGIRDQIAALVAEDQTLGLMLHSPEPEEEQRVIEEALATLDSRLKLHNQTEC
nr:MAG TPA: hypothetical protein [Caudoviricetes sp.]